MCNHKFKKGKNKGNNCPIKKYTDGFCKNINQKKQKQKQKQILNAKQQKKNLQKKNLQKKKSLKKNGKQQKIFLNMKLVILEIVEIKKLKDI